MTMEGNRKYISAGVLNILILALTAAYILFIQLDLSTLHWTLPEGGSDDSLGVGLLLVLMIIYNFLPLAIVGVFTLINGILWLARGANGERLQKPMLIIGTVLKGIALLSCGFFTLIMLASEMTVWGIPLALLMAEIILSIVYDFWAMKKEVAVAMPLDDVAPSPMVEAEQTETINHEEMPK